MFLKNNGADFPGIGHETDDFIWSFAVFVHLEQAIITEYLANMMPILKHGGKAFIQYSDKTKKMARENRSFSDNNPETMRKMVHKAGFSVYDENLDTLPHSSIICFRKD